jgi:hypothetical protein
LAYLNSAPGAAPSSNWRADRQASEQNVLIGALPLARTSNSRCRAERRIRRVGYADGFVAERDGIGIGQERPGRP